MGVNLGVAAYICVLLVVLLAVGFIGEACQGSNKSKTLDEPERRR